MTLNMLRPCRTNLRMLAYTALKREFNYERTPLALPGMKVIIHKKPGNRISWAFHGILDGI